jgi:eukaryotic-like serine/threonine-protein kinase
MVTSGLLLGGRYRIEGRIAAGGMGEVWRASDLMLERGVAVKLLHPEYTRDEECLARFQAEARYAGSLSHPNIAQVYDYKDATPPALPYLVMELVDGPSLAALLAEGPLDPARTVRVIAQAAGGLQAAHAVGLVHRDIKPGNLLVSRGDVVKITDFGIACAKGSSLVTRTGTLMGTPAYLAPERAAGAPAAPAADLYALGIVAHQCLAGRPPFDGEPLAVAIAHLERALPPLPPDVPPGLAALVASLTAKDPRARPSSAAAVAARAEQLSAALSSPGTPLFPTAIFPVAAIRATGEPPAEASTPWHAQRGRAEQNPPSRLRPRARPAVVLAGLAAAGLGGWLLAAAPSTPPARRPVAPLVASPPAAARPGVSSQSGDPQTVGDTHGERHTAPAPSRRARPSASAIQVPTPTSTPVPSGTPTASATPPPTPSETSSPAATASTLPGPVLADGPR